MTDTTEAGPWPRAGSTTTIEHRLPAAQRTMLWIEHTHPTSSAGILQRARAHLDQHAALTLESGYQ